MLNLPRSRKFEIRHFVCAGLLAITANAGWPASAHAANISFEPSISEMGSWDSNPLLLTRNAKPLYGSTTTPRIVVIDQTPTTKLAADVSVSENIFNQSSFDSTDVHGDFGLSHRNERFEIGLHERTDYDTTRTSELTTFGNNVGAIRHFGLSASPYVSFSPLPTEKITLAGKFLASRYESRRFTDYNVYALTPSWTHSFTPLHAGIISLQAQRYQTIGDFGRTVDSIGPSVGWIATFTPRLSGKFSAGLEATKEKNPNIPDSTWKWNSVFSGTLSYKGDQDVTDFTAMRMQQPNSNGTQQLLTTFSIKEKHAINENLFWDFLVSYHFAKNASGASNNLRSLISASTGLTYRATETLDITTKYRFRRETLTDRDEVANGNMVTLGLTYRPYGHIEK